MEIIDDSFTEVWEQKPDCSELNRDEKKDIVGGSEYPALHLIAVSDNVLTIN